MRVMEATQLTYREIKPLIGAEVAADRDALLSYTDEETYRDAGQGGFEIRTFLASLAAAGGQGELQFYTAELPIFAVGCTVARFAVR